MPRRSRRPRRPQTRRTTEQACPCGSGRDYGECCGRLHAGSAKADTAEALMRSRYCAFAVGDAAYLLRTWHPDTRPSELDLSDERRWTGLEILETTGGTAFHAEGTVAFRAHFLDPDGPGTQSEVSEFVRLDGLWLYLTGTSLCRRRASRPTSRPRSPPDSARRPSRSGPHRLRASPTTPTCSATNWSSVWRGRIPASRPTCARRPR
ncbi:SEC-C domain-containing protein [Glycomyces sp. L485]|nr:YchJ family protein [Glycomyces sp. L485]MCH7230879.1 SEC-C domain-containing protein [Glycomyces sp. L485]